MKPETKAKREALARLTHAPKRKGLAQLKKYLAGETLSVKNAVLAKCNECMGNYVDGAVNCGIVTCPLYPFMPFQPNASNTPIE